MVRDRSHIVNLKRAEGRSNFPISPHMPFFFMRFHLACGGLSPAKDSTHVVVPFPSLHCFLLFVINYFFFFFQQQTTFFFGPPCLPFTFPRLQESLSRTRTFFGELCVLVFAVKAVLAVSPLFVRFPHYERQQTRLCDRVRKRSALVFREEESDTRARHASSYRQ